MTTIDVALYSNSDDAFVSWKPSEFIPGCRGFQLERGQKTGAVAKVVIVDNRLGFAADNPKSGDHRPSNVWPFQRFNWTDHAVDVGNEVRYRVTAMVKSPAGALVPGPASDWTPWTSLSADAGGGFACYFNRGIVLSQFVARYMRDNQLTPNKLKAQLKGRTGPFRAFLMGDLGARIFKMLADAKTQTNDLHAALYELDDDALETAIIQVGSGMHLVLSNGSGKAKDGNVLSRANLNGHGIATVDRLLGSKGLGHNKFVVGSDAGGPAFVWTGSTNYSTTGLCTQINNGLLITDPKVAALYRAQWDRLAAASPPATTPAAFPPALKTANNMATEVAVGAAKVKVRFTPTSDGSDMADMQGLIAGAKSSILFLMFTPGPTGLHTLAAQRAAEPGMYVKGVVSTLGMSAADNDKNVLDIQLVGGPHPAVTDRYAVVQPQGDTGIGPWIAEVTRKDFLSQVGHAIVHSKILLIDPLSDDPVVVTGSHNFSKSASTKNDENLVFVRGHKALARAYAAHVMSVYEHYRYRSYIREMQAAGKVPWSYLDDDDTWLRDELRTKAAEIAFWTP